MERHLLMENVVAIVPHYTGSDVSTVNEAVQIEYNAPPQLVVALDEDPLLTDVWIGLILILMVLICVGYICTCIVYHKFRRWKREVLESQRVMNARPSFSAEYAYEESLPSYTIVTGLPSYDQAMEQFRQLRTIRRVSSPKLADIDEIQDAPPRITFARLSLGEIFQFYKIDRNMPV